jgi:hypothetical protein
MARFSAQFDPESSPNGNKIVTHSQNGDRRLLAMPLSLATTVTRRGLLLTEKLPSLHLARGTR